MCLKTPLDYHPYAACLMFRAARDGNTVQANLDAVVAYGRSLGARTSSWQSIETLATKEDGTTCVLVAERKPDGSYAVGEANWTSQGWYWAGNDPTDSWGRQIYPAHWQPLPEPPAAAEGASNAEG